MPSEPNGLDDFTTEQMLAVIGKRYDAFVFVGSQTKNKAAQDLTYCSTGAFHSCLGLVETAKLLVTAGGFEE